MKSREYQKMISDIRRDVSRKYGFRQSSYINFKVENGYFFCMYFCYEETLLTVKPMYADDLWWDIWESSENKNEPLSLRGTGAYSLAGQILASYQFEQSEDRRAVDKALNHIFQNALIEISDFLTKNPDADAFYPDESRMDHDPDRLLYLISLIHNGREKEALAIIKEARKNKHKCMFHSGMFSDSYTYIKRWCDQRTSFERIIIKTHSFIKMAMTRDRSSGLPNEWNFGFFDSGIIMACIVSFNLLGSLYWPALVLSALLLILLDGKISRRYYADFLKLPPKVQRKWKIASWSITIILWIYIMWSIYYYLLKP